MGIPLTSTIKKGKYYYEFRFTPKQASNAILSKMKPFDSKRIKHKIGVINKEDFKNLKEKLNKLYGNMLALSDGKDDPEGICNGILQ